MSFATQLALAAFAGGVLGSLLLFPVANAICRRFGLLDQPGHRKIHAEPILLSGGLAVFLSMGAVLLCAFAFLQSPWAPQDIQERLLYGYGARGTQLGALAFGGVTMLGLGFVDDRLALTARTKFLVQTGVALVVALSGVRVTFFVDLTWAHIVGTVLWLLYVTTIININDNMNGLCGGLSAIASLFFAERAIEQGQYLVAAFAALAAGAMLGFLPFNYPKAQAFLGDSGSHLLGFVVGTLSILTTYYAPDTNHTVWSLATPLLILAVPTVDFLQVSLTRIRRGQPIWIGDTNHLSHRLDRAGLSRPQAVLVLWLGAVASGFLARLL